jgi:glycosyltransferase involved in cell wall biosynthesis
MACGLPVVASDSGAHGEILANSGGGVLCDSKDSVKFAEAMRSVIENRDHYSRNGLAYASKNDWMNVTKQVLDLYYRIL